jgi:hypothetical protein
MTQRGADAIRALKYPVAALHTTANCAVLSRFSSPSFVGFEWHRLLRRLDPSRRAPPVRELG